MPQVLSKFNAPSTDYSDGDRVIKWVLALRANNWNGVELPAAVLAGVQELGRLYGVTKVPSPYTEVQKAVDESGQGPELSFEVRPLDSEGNQSGESIWVSVRLTRNECSLFHGVTDRGQPVRYYQSLNGRSQLLVMP